MKKPFPKLQVDICNDNDTTTEEEEDQSYFMGDSTYRQEGLTIGKDYLRMEGETISRGELHPSKLSLEATIGQGAFNKVQRAVWKCGNEECVNVAVKQYPLLLASQKRDMLIQELRSLCHLNCETLVKLHGAFLQADTVTVVLDYMDSGSLQQVLERRGTPFTLSMVAGVAFQLLHGLDHLHQNRILHRDIKTENCLLNTSGQVKLCDFGIASIMGDQSLNQTVIGTTLFMAPERLQAKEYGKASDVWSLGLVLCHVISGEKPFRHVTSQVDLLMTLEENDLPLHNVDDDGLKEILSSCLRLSPEMRMPARILLQSPWFSVTHGIATIPDAAARVVTSGGLTD
jgi:serine/threonine protein kinase